MSGREEATTPLLRENRQVNHWYPSGFGLPVGLRPDLSSGRRKVQNFLTSKTGHYCILTLVALDVSCIFADFVITIFNCESKHPRKDLEVVLKTLGIVALVFSSLFMVELLASVWAFGLRFFRSKFHILDSLVILASFIVDVLLRGIIEEVASIIIVLRLWRVFKIIEELSMGAQEQMEGLEEKIDSLQQENKDLRRRLRDLESG